MSDTGNPLSALSATELRHWISERDPAELEQALLHLREEALQLTERDPQAARRIVEDIALFVLQRAGTQWTPLALAFQFVRARLTDDPHESFQEVVRETLRCGLPALAARGLTEWADWALARGETNQAERYLREAQRILKRLGRYDEAEALYVPLAQIVCRTQTWSDAAALIECWLPQMTTPQPVARLRLELAQCRLRAGDPVGADDDLRSAAATFAALDDPHGEHVVMVHRARWFWQLGAYERAVAMLEQAGTWFAGAGHSFEAEVASANLAAVWVAAERALPEAARRIETLRTRLGVRDPLLCWQLTMNLAAAREKLGEYAVATSLYEELGRMPGCRAWEKRLAALNFAHLRLRGGVTDDLELPLRAALNDPVVQDDSFLHFLASANQAEWHRQRAERPSYSEADPDLRRRELTVAVDWYYAALRFVEHTRVCLPWEFLRRQLRQARHQAYEELEASLLELHRYGDAWSVATYASAQSFHDFLEAGYPRLDDETRARFLRLRRALTRAYREAEIETQASQVDGRHPRAGGSEASNRDENQAEIDRLECLIDQTLGEGRRQYGRNPPHSSGLVWPALQGGETALIQFTGGRRWGVYVVRDGCVTWFPFSLVGAQILEAEIVSWWEKHRRLAAGFRWSQTTSAGTLSREISSWREQTARWYQALLQPLRNDLEGVGRLIIVPNGPLSLLPWAGLWDPERSRYCGDAFSDGLVILPSARVGQLLDERRRILCADTVGRMSGGSLALVARPESNLPFADLEANWVAEQLGGQLLRPERITCGLLRRLLPRCRWFHYSGHGRFCPERPMATHLQLARGQRWTTWDMLAAPLPGTVVVLSACNVGTAKADQNGEWFGLARGFLLAGARAVVASLWGTLDFGSWALMRAFYRNALATDDLAAALHDSHRQVRLTAEWAERALARRGEIPERMPWQEVLDPHGGPLAAIDGDGQLSDDLAAIKAGMHYWCQSTVGRYANQAQCWRALWTLIGELAWLGHPQYWSGFQLYGVP